MAFELFGTAKREDIRVAYISPDLGLVDNVTICDANAYAKLNPGTVFIFKRRDKIKYLNINAVNALTPDELSPEEVAVLIDAGEYHNPDQRMAQALTSQIYGGTTHIHVEEYTEDEQKRLMSLFDDMEDEIEERKQLTSREEADDLIQQGIEHARAIQ